MDRSRRTAVFPVDDRSRRPRSSQTFVGLINVSPKTEPSPYNTPPWRRSHLATSPNGLVTAEIAEAREHSMSNPTVGTLKMSTGLEVPRCNPAFLWSDDSRYLAVPQWIRRFGIFLRQRLLIVDVNAEKVFASRFTYWLIDPKNFCGGRLELAISSSSGINWMRPERLVIDVRNTLDHFKLIPSGHNMTPTKSGKGHHR